ncbi:hypothetical protein CDEF62S_05373 [Castellaniella defragrans]
MSPIDSILGIQGPVVQAVRRAQDIHVWAKPGQRATCPRCAGQRVCIKGAHYRTLKLGKSGRPLTALMDAAEEDVLAYMNFPPAHRTKLHSTNPIERLNHEIKRRAEVVSIFPNEAAIRRLAGAILCEQTDKWVVQRGHYMPHEALNEILYQPVTDLQAVAN